MKLVVYPAVEPDCLAAYEAAALESTFVNAESEADAIAAMPDADALLGKLTPDMLSVADQLRWVQSFTASLEHYVFPALVEHPFILTNARGLYSDVIADQVMGYMICFARNLHTYIRRQLDRTYSPIGGEEGRVNSKAGPSRINSIDRGMIFLPNATLGIVGFGAIGREIGKRAQAFGMKIRAVDRIPEQTKKLEGVDVQPLSNLDQLLRESDFVAIAAPQTPETTKLFDAKLLGRMKPGAYLINVGRGAIVVLDDLVDALASGALAGAALDVFEIEPLPASHRLWDFPNVIITPHTAGYSTEVAGRHRALIVENIRRFHAGEPLLNVVHKQLWF
jgi:phosphoglycerate dehydrogenase-like enzyme